MTINIYWSCFEKEWMRAREPESILKRLFSIKKSDSSNPNNNINQCPAMYSYLKNVFALKSIYDYNFSIKDNGIVSSMHDQQFMDNHVIIRDIEQKFFSFSQKYIFFTDEDSLKMTAYLHPIFEKNEIEKTTFSIPGEFDIGKWFRNIEFPFYLKDEYSSFNIRREDFYTYVKFDTEEKIIFKQFIPVPAVEFYLNSTLSSYSNMTHGKNSLNNYYEMLKFKDNIIEEINKNLVS